MATGKELSGIELELSTAASSLEKSIAAVVERISNMKQFQYSGSVASDELEAISAAGDHLRRRRSPDPAAGASISVIGKRGMRKKLAELEKDLAESEALHKSLDKCEAKFKMYNLPMRDENESLEAYLERVGEYMRVTWRDPAAICRRKEHKSLLEWVSELGRAGSKRRATFEAMRSVLVELGARISRHLINYLWVSAVALEREELLERVREVESLIRRLKIEEKNSAVIDSFVSVVGFFERTMKAAKKIDNSDHHHHHHRQKKSEGGESRVLLHMIAMEVLRLEVSFGSPDLPMMLLDEVFLMMGKHLMDNVFEEKMVRIGNRFRRLKSELPLDPIMSIFEQVLDLGVNQVWNEIRINASYSLSS